MDRLFWTMIAQITISNMMMVSNITYWGTRFWCYPDAWEKEYARLK